MRESKDMYGSGFGREDWYLLRDAVLSAMYHRGKGECAVFERLPDHLKETEVGRLVERALKKGKKSCLDKAAELLAGGSDQAGIILAKS